MISINSSAVALKKNKLIQQIRVLYLNVKCLFIKILNCHPTACDQTWRGRVHSE